MCHTAELPPIRPEFREALFQALAVTDGAFADGTFRIAEILKRPTDPPMFWMEGTVSAPLRLVAAMIRESDLSTLAGTLLRWDVLESEAAAPFRRRIFYVSKLPWPFKNRAFHISSWFEQPTSNSFGILSTSIPSNGDMHAAAGTSVWGDVAFSGYHLVSLGPRLCWLRRVIGIELRLPMPRRLLCRSLVQVYRGNYKWMSKAACSDLVLRFEQRIANDPFYSSLP